jgi:hypothetical protein
MVNKRTVRRLAGETMRDIGILLFVFFPMDAFFQPMQRAWAAVALMLCAALLFIAVGITFEANE